ncbi:uncharacterized protein IL334_006847 [Kwoniella shivajii]|uniref:RRM domain-containing protein n=1 Tax=Kwoniella shivajii TaxID=564305 RepID=A0ABZ1D7R6_9TREE|nr:hypothetical protein IL334_006847 [Kwoniella shivajii]
MSNKEVPLPSSIPGSPDPPTTDFRQEDAHQGFSIANSKEGTPRAPNNELRIYCLNPAVTAENLISFFSGTTRVLGVLIHPQPTTGATLQWAQLWVESQEELQRCMTLREHLAPSGITLSKAPSTGAPPIQGLLTPELDTLALEVRAPPTPPSLSRNMRSDLVGLGYRHIDPAGPLPRNLYVMGLPLDLTQMQFKSLFSQYGMVEHSTLLSQLDGMGRRRGFILMSTHREATEVMKAMNGTWIEGFKIDVSWAIVQREARNIGQIVHPPALPARRELSEECAVLVENLDPEYFPNAGAIRDIFNAFGPVARVSIVSVTPLHAVIHFDHEVSATALLNANGLSLGGRPVHTRRYIRPALQSVGPHRREILSSGQFSFDPFCTDYGNRFSNFNMLGSSGSLTSTSLNANSEPFVPIPFHNARWLSASNDRTSANPHFDNPRYANDGHSSSDVSLTNSNSGSTKTSSTNTGARANMTENKATLDQHDKNWPLPSATVPVGQSRWTSAPS